MEHNAYSALGKVIKAARKARKMTQEELGELVDFGQRHIMSIEKEEKRPSFDKLCEIIHVLNIDANLIFYPEKTASTDSEDATMVRLSRLLSLFNDHELKTITALVEAYLSDRRE